MDEILKQLNRSKRKIIIKKKSLQVPVGYSPILSTCSLLYLHRDLYFQITELPVEDFVLATKILKPNKKDKLEWQVVEATQLYKLKLAFGRSLYFCICASAAGTQAAQP